MGASVTHVSEQVALKLITVPNSKIQKSFSCIQGRIQHFEKFWKKEKVLDFNNVLNFLCANFKNNAPFFREYGKLNSIKAASMLEEYQQKLNYPHPLPPTYKTE